MKKKVSVITFVASILISVSCFAEGAVSVTDKIAYIFSGKDSGYFYAKVENEGDAPVGVDNGKLVLFSGNDDILVTSDYVNTYPSRVILNPGEYTYISEFLWDSKLKNQSIGDDHAERGSWKVPEAFKCDFDNDFFFRHVRPPFCDPGTQRTRPDQILVFDLIRTGSAVRVTLLAVS